MVEYLFIVSLVLHLAGGLFALCLFKWQGAGNFISLVFAAIASCFSIATSVILLSTGATVRLDFSIYHAIIKYNFLLDPVSAYFVLTISTISFVAAIYSIGYTRLYINKRDTRFLGFLYNLFIVSMLLVVTANNAVVFMILWELMTIVSFFLVIYEHDKPATMKAGFTYIIMAHVGSALLAVAFFIMFAHVGTWDFGFDDFR